MEKYSLPQQPNYLMFSAIALTLISLPFAIADLYFGFSSQKFPCLCLPILTTKVSFTMGTWLKVHGFVIIGLSLILSTNSVVIHKRRKDPSKAYHLLFFIHLLTLVLTAMFRISWSIVGGVMYFGYLEGSCGGFDGYLLLTIVVGIVIVLISCALTRVKSDMEKISETSTTDRIQE